MSITVKFFANLRETVGKADEILIYSEHLNVEQVWNMACNNQPMPSNTLCAVNMEYVDLSAPIKDNDEIAFFPPVTGGQHD